MNIQRIRKACLALGLSEPISIEMDGTVWLGSDDDRTYPDMKKINAKVVELEQEEANHRQETQNKLAALGLTVEEILALLK